METGMISEYEQKYRSMSGGQWSGTGVGGLPNESAAEQTDYEIVDDSKNGTMNSR